MPIYVGLGNWTDQGLGSSVASCSEPTPSAGGGRLVGVRELVWTLGECDFISIVEAPDDETAAALILQVSAQGNVRTKTMRAFDADQMTDIIARTG